MDPVVVLIAVLAVAVLLLSVIALRRAPPDRHAGVLQQQLIEVRDRLERLAAAQADVPTALAAGRAEQAQSLAERLGDISDVITRHLQSSRVSMDQRMTDTGQAMADVRERLGRLSEATRRLETLGASVAEVRELLRVPRLRGTLGEVWLEELLRQIFPEALFQTQYTFKSGERVDAVLRLGGRLIAIDAKFPLEACQRMLAADGHDRAREQRAFRRSIKARIDEIAHKYVVPDEGTLDFALMYIPAEGVYYEAVVRESEPADDDSVMAYALAKRVIPVSPNTFYAYLSAILHGLRGLHVEQRAREILERLSGLQGDVGKLDRAHQLVGRHLDNAVRQYAEVDRQLQRLEHKVSDLLGYDPLPASSDAREPTPAEATDGPPS